MRSSATLWLTGKTMGWRSALDKATGDWLGFVTLNYIGPGTQGFGTDGVEIGWWIIRAAWGRGYASEGAAAIRDEAFERIGLDRIIARLQPANVASAHAEKIGMSFHCDTTGRVGEVLRIYALDRSEWSRQLQRENACGRAAAGQALSIRGFGISRHPDTS
jgi:RimJ/RimL family protein N-acetyltransferase